MLRPLRVIPSMCQGTNKFFICSQFGVLLVYQSIVIHSYWHRTKTFGVLNHSYWGYPYAEATKSNGYVWSNLSDSQPEGLAQPDIPGSKCMTRSHTLGPVPHVGYRPPQAVRERSGLWTKRFSKRRVLCWVQLVHVRYVE